MFRYEISLPETYTADDGLVYAIKFDQIALELTRQFGGVTITPTVGYWLNPQGLIEREEGRQLVVWAGEHDDNYLRSFCEDLQLLYNQQWVPCFLTIGRHVVPEPRKEKQS